MSWRNLATWDRALRIVLGTALVVLGLSDIVGGLGGIALSIFGWLPPVTGILGWCPIYALLGTATYRAP